MFFEYRFPEDPPGSWRLSSVTRDAVDQFRRLKFEDWRRQITEPQCEAAFKLVLHSKRVKNSDGC